VLSDFNICFLRKLREVVAREKIDLIIVAAEPYGVTLASIACHGIPIVYEPDWVSADAVEVVFRSTHAAKRIAKPLLRVYISLIERLACKRAKHIVAISEIDRQRLIALYNVDKEKITVIPPYVNLDKFENASSRESTAAKNRKVTVIFHGPYNHPANREAFDLIINYIAPQVQKRNSNIEFLLAGMNAPVFEKGNVKFLGFVEDLQGFLRNASIAIVPLLEGTGVKIKVFDYMTAGLPIIATEKALEGIEVENGKHVISTSGVDQEFVNAILDLADNRDKREMLGRNALEMAKTRYSRERMQARVDEMLAKIMSSRR
jgi:glycosyltransferase involved in cell wall biosynthesis